jgi:hypothetical protein
MIRLPRILNFTPTEAIETYSQVAAKKIKTKLQIFLTVNARTYTIRNTYEIFAKNFFN